MTFYVDYNWDVHSDRLVLDRDFDITRAGWKEGEYFKMAYVDGRHQFIRIDPVEQFSKGWKTNGA